MKGSPEIVLASASPRRQLILKLLGIPYRVLVTDIDEWSVPHRDPRDFAIKAARAKAMAAEQGQQDETLIVASDTIVVLGGKIFGKPQTPENAREMLGQMSGCVHQVITGIAVRSAGISTLLDATTAAVRFREISKTEIRDYVASGEPMDKAGAYAAQGRGRELITSIEGDYFTVVGLSASKLLQMLGLFMDVRSYTEALERLTPESLEQNLCRTG